MEIEFRDVSVSAIGETVGPPPSAKLARHVAELGVIQPVILQEITSDQGEITYQIIDGNRRVAAARQAELEAVPAQVVHNAKAEDAAYLTLITNSFRSANYLTEFWAINQLQRSGQDPASISRHGGLSPDVLRTRGLFSDLDRRIFVGMSHGVVSPAVALSVARLPKDLQRQLAEQFERTGKLEQRDVKQLAPTAAELAEEMPTDVLRTLAEVARVAQTHGIGEDLLIAGLKNAMRAARHGDDGDEESL